MDMYIKENSIIKDFDPIISYSMLVSYILRFQINKSPIYF